MLSEDQPCDKSVLRQNASVGGEDTCSMSSITFPIQSNEQTKRSIWAWQRNWGNVWLTDDSQGRLFSKMIKDLCPCFQPSLGVKERCKKKHVYEHTANWLILNQLRLGRRFLSPLVNKMSYKQICHKIKTTCLMLCMSLSWNQRLSVRTWTWVQCLITR